jgi:hypothetical protein
MSSNSFALSSLRYLNFPIILSADGTLLLVGHSFCFVLFFSCSGRYHEPIFSSQPTDSGFCAIHDTDSCPIQDHRTKALVGDGPLLHDSQGLWDLE